MGSSCSNFTRPTRRMIGSFVSFQRRYWREQAVSAPNCETSLKSAVSPATERATCRSNSSLSRARSVCKAACRRSRSATLTWSIQRFWTTAKKAHSEARSPTNNQERQKRVELVCKCTIPLPDYRGGIDWGVRFTLLNRNRQEQRRGQDFRLSETSCTLPVLEALAAISCGFVGNSRSGLLGHALAAQPDVFIDHTGGRGVRHRLPRLSLHKWPMKRLA